MIWLIIGFACVVFLFLIVKFNRNKSKNKQAIGKQLSASEKIISSLDLSDGKKESVLKPIKNFTRYELYS